MTAEPTYEVKTAPLRNFDAFYEEWGEKSGFENKEQFKRLWQVAELSYGDPPLEYHNFGHALDVLWRSMELADLVEDNGDNVKETKNLEFDDRKHLILAVLFHDAGYFEDFTKKNCYSPEEYSADLFTEAAENEKMSDEDIYQVRKLILKTSPGYTPESRQERIIVRADLDNIGRDYRQDFFPASVALMSENLKLTEERGGTFNETFYVANSIQILANYLNQNLGLGPAYDKEYPEWHANAVNNLIKYTKEQALFRNQDLIAFVRSIGNPLVSRLVLVDQNN